MTWDAPRPPGPCTQEKRALLTTSCGAFHVLTVFSSTSPAVEHRQQVPWEMPPYLAIGSASKLLPQTTRFRPQRVSRRASKKCSKKPSALCCGTRLLRMEGSFFLVATTALCAFRNKKLRIMMRCFEACEPIAKCFEVDTLQCLAFLTLPQIISHTHKAKYRRTRRGNRHAVTMREGHGIGSMDTQPWRMGSKKKTS